MIGMPFIHQIDAKISVSQVCFILITTQSHINFHTAFAQNALNDKCHSKNWWLFICNRKPTTFSISKCSIFGQKVDNCKSFLLEIIWHGWYFGPSSILYQLHCHCPAGKFFSIQIVKGYCYCFAIINTFTLLLSAISKIARNFPKK